MIVLIMTASLIGSVVLIGVCAPLAHTPPAPPTPYVFEQEAPRVPAGISALFSQQFKAVFSQIRKENKENTGCGMIRLEIKCGGAS